MGVKRYSPLWESFSKFFTFKRRAYYLTVIVKYKTNKFPTNALDTVQVDRSFLLTAKIRQYFTRASALPLKATITSNKRTSNKEAIPGEVTTLSPTLREEGFASDSKVRITCSVETDVPSFSRYSLHRVDTERAGTPNRISCRITFQNILPMRLIQLAVYLSRPTIGGRAGMSQICPRFGRGRHGNRSSRGLI